MDGATVIPRLRTMRLLLILCAIACLGSAELEIRDVVWGFAGTVLPGSFAPCDLLLANPAQQPVAGVLRLRDAGALGGVPWDAEVWIGPGATRWVRFAPLIRTGDQERHFTLSWRGGLPIADLPVPAIAAPGPVLLIDEGAAPRRARLPTCPAERFPAGSALLDGLGCLVVDSVPRRWEPAQAAALAAWVNGGGTLALLRPDDGTPPSPAGFGPGLHLGRNGAGEVLPVAWPREACGLGELQSAGWHPAVWHPEGESHHEDLDSVVAQALAGMVRPQHPWGWIRTVLIVFGIAVGPIAWRLGRRGLDWRWLNLGLIGLIIITTLVLVQLGRRGYGEAAAWNAVAILRPAGTVVEAEVRSAIFVTSSGTRRISHPAPLNLYACPAEETPVEGAVSGGTLATAIPLYSTRHLLWRGSVALPTPAVSVVGSTDGRPSALTINGAGTIHAAAVWDGSALHHLAAQGSEWRTWGNPSTAQSLARDSRPSGGSSDLPEVGKSLFSALSLHALGGLGQSGAWLERPLRPGGCVLLVLATIPDGLAPDQGMHEPHRGLALWRLELSQVQP